MPDTWSIVESDFEVAHNRHYEGLMAIGSGTLAQRASLEEGLSDDPQDREYLRIMGNVSVEQFPSFKSRVGTYLPGVVGPHPTCGEQMINLPAIHGLVTYAGGERLDMESSRIADYRRHLDLRRGHLIRELTWLTRTGSRLGVRFDRFISASRRHVMALRCTVRHLGGRPAELRFLGTLDAEVRTNGFDHFRSVDITGQHEPITLAVRANSGIEVAAAALLTSDRGVLWSVDVQPRWVGCRGSITLESGQSLTVDKFAALTSSQHVSGPPVDVARKLVWDAAAAGFERLAAESDAVWERRWQQTDVVIEGDPASQLALRTALYHLLRAAVEDDPRCAIDAKAACGEAYCGRYFWDSDIFMLPVFLYTRPEVGKTLARFRISSLEGARRNARRYGYCGAKYAWESSPSGDEHCPNWQYADHQVHVTADVAYGLVHAHRADSGDREFLRQAVEVLVEAARYWCQRVTYVPERDRYELLMVMGPDEYTPFSRNNAYTNRLAAFGLTAAVELWRELEDADPDGAERVGKRLTLEAQELARFTEVARKIYFPYDPARRLVLQSDDFFGYERLDFDRWWPDRSKPLGACVSQERLYRSQVLKQADVLQLMALFPQEFDAEQMRVAYETYLPLTCHDSSLSKPVHALIAAWLGRQDEALRFWKESVSLDLQPDQAAEGVHAACAGASWQALMFGFAGLSSYMQSETLAINPRLAPDWSGLRFPFVWRGQPLYVDIEPARVAVQHRGRRPLEAIVRGQRCRLTPGQTSFFG